MHIVDLQDSHRAMQRAKLYRDTYPKFAQWATGYGVITHQDETQLRVFDLCQQILCEGRFKSLDDVLEVFIAADHLANAGMWLVVHMTYCQRVDLGGRELAAEDFKPNPQGHTGGSLNMVIAYVAYFIANHLSGVTRSWLMGQGHCVAAIDSVNVLLQNLYPEQADRYPLTNAGLTQLVQDFYSYAITDDGRPGVPLGSHVNPHTGGGLIEGGYLGFAELQYVHMPLPGERLVAFLSDGAFEEQRGSDWASRWWRAEDCGLVTPVMIANGRRIDQRSTMYQQGGLSWFFDHLQLNGSHPIPIDGRDPAAFVWGIFESEARLMACASQIQDGQMQYPVRLPYLIAETEKGFGFYGAGTNAAHGAPLPAIPRFDKHSRALFSAGATRLFVPRDELEHTIAKLALRDSEQRPPERHHSLTTRQIKLAVVSEPLWSERGQEFSPMAAVDGRFCEWHLGNPDLRVRVGNPDELRSNRMGRTLDLLKHRVLHPEVGVAESVHGSVITALNEEAVVSAALGNKGGINLVVSYEAFAMKMIGALRQEIIFSRHQKVLGRRPGWLSVPVIATSHLWENGKNEQSHQDSTFGEVLLGEASDIARVVYPADANTAMACLDACFQSQGEIWGMTIPKQEVATVLDPTESRLLVSQGAMRLEGDPDARVQLVAVGAYQLQECRATRVALAAKGISSDLVYLLEPGRFRQPRDQTEKEHVARDELISQLFPSSIALRVFVTHLRPEVLLGVCRPIDLGVGRCCAFGYRNQGGTLDTAGLLRANGCDAKSIAAAILERIDVV